MSLKAQTGSAWETDAFNAAIIPTIVWIDNHAHYWGEGTSMGNLLVPVPPVQSFSVPVPPVPESLCPSIPTPSVIYCFYFSGNRLIQTNND